MKREIHRSFPDEYEHSLILSQQLRDEVRRKNVLTDIVQMVNTGDFIGMCCNDLDILIDHLCSRPSRTRASLYARVAYLIIFELFDDVPALIGKDFQKIVSKFTGEDRLREFRSITKKFSCIQKDHKTHIRDIRNFVIAHRDHNVEAQLAIMKTLDFRSVIALATELVRWHTLFINFQTRMYGHVIEVLHSRQV